MELPDLNTMIPVGVLTAIGTLVLTIQKISKNFKKEHEEREAKILQQAKEEDALVKAKLEARIEKALAELKNLELSVNKDIGFIKESYGNEIKNLGEKIESLRNDLRSQHTQLVDLLSEMIKNRD